MGEKRMTMRSIKSPILDAEGREVVTDPPRDLRKIQGIVRVLGGPLPPRGETLNETSHQRDDGDGRTRRLE